MWKSQDVRVGQPKIQLGNWLKSVTKLKHFAVILLCLLVSKILYGLAGPKLWENKNGKIKKYMFCKKSSPFRFFIQKIAAPLENCRAKSKSITIRLWYGHWAWALAWALKVCNSVFTHLQWLQPDNSIIIYNFHLF